MNPDAVPILLDTDIGTDIDDALALSYLFRQPSCHLLGITTVGPEAARRADLARALCKAWDRSHVPVFAGHEPAGSLPDRRTDPWQAYLLDAPSSAGEHDPREAIDFLANVIPLYAGRITLVTIGPLTNVARLVDEHPDAAAHFDAVVSMCGLFTEPPPGYGAIEHNIGLDPEAAARVLDAGLPQHHILGLEVTGAFEMKSDEFCARLPAATPKLLRTLLGAWADRRDTVRFHDPLAAASVFAPQLFTFRPARCTVTLDAPGARGRTGAAHTGDPMPHQLAIAADYNRFVHHFLETLR
jgi:inosine-uridine nucleoside N-ribohydrolase